MVLDRVRQWILGFPGMAEVVDVAVDYHPAVPGTVGVAPVGAVEVARQADILGGLLVWLRYEFRLTVVLEKPEGDDQLALRNVEWLEALQAWVRQQSAAGAAPVLGDRPELERVRTEDGKLERVCQEGTAVYRLGLIFEFVEAYEGGNV